MKKTTAYGARDCSLCNKTINDGDEYTHVAINSKQHSICTLCSSKLYYHYRDIIFDKIKHP